MSLLIIRGEFEVLAGGTVSCSGAFRTEGTVSLDLRSGSPFNSPLNIILGITTAADISSPYKARPYGPVTIDTKVVPQDRIFIILFAGRYGNVSQITVLLTSSTGAELILQAVLIHFWEQVSCSKYGGFNRRNIECHEQSQSEQCEY
ncbi:MAG: hypothetical protein IPI04_18695 [Ignavibacteria bacterium]|nr:hypothetical protein [Ignavibacteria bacterium]